MHNCRGDAPLIAIVLPDLRPGGVEVLSILLAEEFIRHGYDVDFVLQQTRGELINAIPVGANLIDLKVRRIRYAVVPLMRYLRTSQAAVLLSAMWPLSGIAVLAARASCLGCRVVVSEHTHLSRSAAVRGMSDIVHHRAGRFIYGRADSVICVSQGVRDDLLQRTGLDGRRVHVIYNPVKPFSGSTGDVRPEIVDWWYQGGERLIAVGSLKRAKDYPTLLRAFARLRSERDARLLILGEGAERPALEQLIGKLGLVDSVRLAGYVADPYPYLETADLFVLSSAWEGLGNVIIEALVCGTPVVATDCPSGPAEILENGRYGRLVPVGDPQALAAAMAASLAGTPDREFLRARGAEFSVERAADQYLQLLDPGGKLLAGA
jgi:glycosyltransferase involved in cell wall biosynthesis